MGAPLPARPSRVPRWALWAVAVPAALGGGLAAAHQPLAAAYVRHRAAGYGVELTFDGLELRRDAIKLTGASATLAGVRGLRVEAARLKLKVPGFDVESVEAADVRIVIEGSATDRMLELATWSSEHAAAAHLPGSARELRLEWRQAAGASPWLALSGGALSSDGKNARLSAAAAQASGVSLGAVGASFAVDARGGVAVELGKTAAGEPLVTARLDTSGEAPRVDVSLRPVGLDVLGPALGVSLPAPGATASGRAELTLSRRGVEGPAVGSASLQIDGWVPPHPRELGGVISGKRTTFATKLSIAPDQRKVTLTETVARAGKLKLEGGGAVNREGDHALVKLDLAGPIACADLVRSAARSELGLLGEIAGDIAAGAVGGVVSVGVSVEADTRDLRAAKIKPRVGVGCGLGK